LKRATLTKKKKRPNSSDNRSSKREARRRRREVLGWPVLGEAHLGGPVILVWDDVKKGAQHPECGHNVVFHEFAHKLDMLDGDADGAPPLHGKEQYASYAEV